MKAHAGEGHFPRALTEDDKKRLHPMQIEMLFGEIHFGRFGVLTKTESSNPEEWTVEYDDRDTCSYCGSIGIDDAIQAFQTPGVEWSGSDWKYGFPHKLYVNIPCEPYERSIGAKYENGKRTDMRGVSSKRSYKFYTTHMSDATPTQVEQWNKIAAPICGIEFNIDPVEGLKWRAPFHGYQGHGTIGKESAIA